MGICVWICWPGLVDLLPLRMENGVSIGPSALGLLGDGVRWREITGLSLD